jgi:cation-transporting P-type ATPase C
MISAVRPPQLLRPEPEVLSQVRGRLSLRLAACRNSRAQALGIELALRKLRGVVRASADPRTARVLVHYDPELLGLDQIRAAIVAAEPTAADLLAAQQDDAEVADLRAHRDRLIVGGSVLAGLLLKRLLFGPFALAGSPLLFGVSTVATIVSGWPFLRGGLRALRGQSTLDTDSLITAATVASLLLRESVTSLVVLWLLNLGELLQELTLRRTRRAIQDLLSLGEEDVWLLASGTEVKVALETVQPGDTIAVYSGDRLPVDGAVVEGQGTVNQAPITGESIPVYKTPGDEVFAGTILEFGALKVRASQVGTDTAVGRLIERVEQARELKAPIETVAEGFSRRFVPFSFALSAAVFLLTRDVRRAMTMLVIACPCAAGLSTPTAVSAAIGNGARRGVLIKGGVHLEAAARIDTVIFDKTGTLTTGRARVARVLSLDAERLPEEVLRIAASGELHSRHPLALAVLRHIHELEVEVPDHEECDVIVGRGMRADLGGNRILVGSQQLMLDFEGPLPASLPAELRRFREEGETVLCVGVNEQLIGLIGVRDLVRPEALEAVTRLRQIGVRRILLSTGDSVESAEIVARALELEEYQGELLPDDKFRLVRGLQAAGHRVAMVGDGVNDAPALALADLGLAMGTAGSDVAIEAADVALAGDDIRDVASVLDLSRWTLGVVRQNYALSLGVNAGGVLVGALGALNPILAALLHNLSTLAVVLNSSRLIGYQPGPRGERSLTAPAEQLALSDSELPLDLLQRPHTAAG